MKKRTAVHLIETLNCGGTENNLLQLLPGLEKTGWHNIIITLSKGGEMLSRFQKEKVEVIVLNQGSFVSPKTIFTLVKTLKSLKPDLIITNLLRADMVGRLILPRLISVPIISYLHTTYNHQRYLPARFFEFVTKPLARHYIANSVAVKNFYQNHFRIPSEKITVVEGGVDIAAFQSASGELVRQELQLPREAMVITCVGNLAPNKGQTLLLEAFESVCATNKNAFLLLVGEGENRKILEAQKEKYQTRDRILLLGRRTDIPSILHLTRIFVLPTFFEGLSVALLEAMAAKKAIITTDIAENRVILKHNQSALLVKPGETRELTQMLKKLLADQTLEKELADNAFSHVLANYSKASFAPKFAQAMNQV